MYVFEDTIAGGEQRAIGIAHFSICITDRPPRALDRSRGNHPPLSGRGEKLRIQRHGQHRAQIAASRQRRGKSGTGVEHHRDDTAMQRLIPVEMFGQNVERDPCRTVITQIDLIADQQVRAAGRRDRCVVAGFRRR